MQYTYLEKLLSHGLYVVVKDKETGDFNTITPSSQKIMRNDCKDWEFVEAYYQPFKPFEVGQRVKVIESGEEVVIITVYNNKHTLSYQVKTEDGYCYSYNHSKLLPLEEETPITLSDEELLQEVKRRNLVEVKEFQTLKDYIREN